MATLHELTNVLSGEFRAVLCETGQTHFDDILGKEFYAGTVWGATRHTKPGFVRDDFFKDHTRQNGGEWREAAPGVWVYHPPEGAATAS